MPINVNEAINAAAEAIKIGDLRKAVIYYSNFEKFQITQMQTITWPKFLPIKDIQ